MNLNKKITSKIFLKLFFSFLSLFILFHLLIWHFYASKIFNLPQNYYVGDLGRMSYQTDLLTNRKTEVTLDRKFLTKETYSNQPIDIITIGDSFSNGGAFGLNLYYQDYLATYYNLNIINIHPLDDKDYINTIIGLYNNGTLKRLHPKAIIIEHVERLMTRLYKNVNDTSYTSSLSNINSALNPRNLLSPIPNITIINSINHKILRNKLLYSFKDKVGSVYKLKLSNNLFSTNPSDELLIHNDEIKFLKQHTEENIKRLNDRLNQLAIMLEKINIKLYFMPAVDKYDLYYDTIESNFKYPKNPFFSMLRSMHKEYYLVDTKAILIPLINKKVKDVFYADDTHWSYIASEAIAKNKIFYNNFAGVK